ncbi:hypothetical protein CPC08DRAFT_711594 [Agrocybe pediades]|nr:hypothetical protein CPC08DRAFT_711594 [Agrocybe pediades]
MFASSSSTSNIDGLHVDLEAQNFTPSQVPSRPDPILSDLGYRLYLETHDSRHDEDVSRRRSLGDFAPPPAYSEEAAIPLPEYTLHAPEPVTLAMYLFKFGFLFFPFWIFGAFILLSPLNEPPASSTDAESPISTPAWMPEKTEEERREMMAALRAVELKWARRCLCALLVLVVLAVTAGVVAWAVLRH